MTCLIAASLLDHHPPRFDHCLVHVRAAVGAQRRELFVHPLAIADGTKRQRPVPRRVEREDADLVVGFMMSAAAMAAAFARSSFVPPSATDTHAARLVDARRAGPRAADRGAPAGACPPAECVRAASGNNHPRRSSANRRRPADRRPGPARRSRCSPSSRASGERRARCPERRDRRMRARQAPTRLASGADCVTAKPCARNTRARKRWLSGSDESSRTLGDPFTSTTPCRHVVLREAYRPSASTSSS